MFNKTIVGLSILVAGAHSAEAAPAKITSSASQRSTHQKRPIAPPAKVASQLPASALEEVATEAELPPTAPVEQAIIIDRPTAEKSHETLDIILPSSSSASTAPSHQASASTQVTSSTPTTHGSRSLRTAGLTLLGTGTATGLIGVGVLGGAEIIKRNDVRSAQNTEGTSTLEIDLSIDDDNDEPLPATDEPAVWHISPNSPKASPVLMPSMKDTYFDDEDDFELTTERTDQKKNNELSPVLPRSQSNSSLGSASENGEINHISPRSISVSLPASSSADSFDSLSTKSSAHSEDASVASDTSYQSALSESETEEGKSPTIITGKPKVDTSKKRANKIKAAQIIGGTLLAASALQIGIGGGLLLADHIKQEKERQQASAAAARAAASLKASSTPSHEAEEEALLIS
jgi:hypothetical protein